MTSRTYLAYSEIDGIHLRCRECEGWDEPLGDSPSAAAAYAKALVHVAHAHNGKPSMEGTRHLEP